MIKGKTDNADDCTIFILFRWTRTSVTTRSQKDGNAEDDEGQAPSSLLLLR